MRNKKGFTLIELLAVIVILAIIALIATPIVLDIISDTRNSSQLRSADFYLDGVEYAISQSILDNKVVESGTYNIIEDGNICLKYKSDKVECIDVLKVDVSGGVPKKGSTITVIDGEIKKVNLQYEQSSIMKNKKGDVEFFKNEYEIGDEIVFNPGDVDRTWNVIDEDIDTVTLMLNENLGDTVAWYKPDKDNNHGPITALSYLNTLTTNWTNVDPIDNYVYIKNKDGNEVPNGYQKLEIKDGKAATISKNGTKNEIAGETKARLITVEEVFEVGQIFNENLKEENLRNYLENNLSMINSFAISQGINKTITTVDEAIQMMLTLPITTTQNESKYIITYYFVKSLSEMIGQPYDLNLPELLLQNLNPDVQYSGYETLSSDNMNGNISYRCVDVSGYLVGVDTTSVVRNIRPIITIPKTKLN